MSKNESEASKTGKKKHKKKKLQIYLTIAVLACAIDIALCIVLGVTVKNADKKYKELEMQYEELLLRHTELGEDLRASKADAGNAQNSVDELAALIEELRQEIANYQEAAEDAANNVMLSENYRFQGTDWNLIKNVSSDGYIKVSSNYYYVVYAANNDVSVASYNEGLTCIGSKTYRASEGQYITFPENIDYVKVSAGSDKTLIFASTGIKVDTLEVAEKKAFYVVSNNSPVSLKLSEAVNKLCENGTVLVLPGTYNDNVSVTNKSVNIYGTGRDICIIRSYDNDYFNPTLEIAAGTVSNISFLAMNDGRGTVENGAYAVHADYNFSYGRNLKFINCNIYSEYNAGAGIGLRGAGSLAFSGCKITGLDKGMFVHDSDDPNVGGSQYLYLENNTIVGKTGNLSMVIASQDVDNASVTIKALNNSFVAATGEDSKSVWTTNVDNSTYEGFFCGLKNFSLDINSSGNSVSILNYESAKE